MKYLAAFLIACLFAAVLLVNRGHNPLDELGHRLQITATR